MGKLVFKSFRTAPDEVGHMAFAIKTNMTRLSAVRVDGMDPPSTRMMGMSVKRDRLYD
jgi:hypothetical protein